MGKNRGMEIKPKVRVKKSLHSIPYDIIVLSNLSKQTESKRLLFLSVCYINIKEQNKKFSDQVKSSFVCSSCIVKLYSQ